jgi:hypothetical protein
MLDRPNKVAIHPQILLIWNNTDEGKLTRVSIRQFNFSVAGRIVADYEVEAAERQGNDALD